MFQIEQELHATAQPINDQNGNPSPLSLSIDRVGMGTTSPQKKLHIFTQPSDRQIRLEDNAGFWEFWAGGNFLIREDGTDDRFFIRGGSGNVGIGTTTPQEKLVVEGSIVATGDIRLSGADCAEDFDIEESQVLEPGTVMVISDAEKLRQCAEAYDTKVAGVLSGAGNCRPGIILGKQPSQNKRMPLALTGKVYCKVDAQYAPINLGDLLTTSPTLGHAMKANDPFRAFGAILGKALRPLAKGQGLIPILIALQ